MEEPIYHLGNLNFNGPLDLLLQLLEKNKVDIYDIPIAEITEQYLDYVRQLQTEDLELVSGFLVMAATLLEIKAKMLLPREALPEEEEEDPRAELAARLLAYKKYKYLAEALCGCEDQAEALFYGQEEIPAEVKSYIPPVNLDGLLGGVTLQDLQRVFREVMARREEKVDQVRSDFGVIKRERISLSARIGSVLGYVRKKRRFSFRQMLENSHERMEVVVTFLALLELMKMGKIEVLQREAFADIEVQATQSADEELDLSGIEDDV